MQILDKEDIKIISMIAEICSDLHIPYKSHKYTHISTFKKDVEKFSDIYLRLKEIEGELSELRDKYPEVLKRLTLYIAELHEVDHHLIIEAKKITRRRLNTDVRIKEQKRNSQKLLSLFRWSFNLKNNFIKHLKK